MLRHCGGYATTKYPRGVLAKHDLFGGILINNDNKKNIKK